MGTKRRDYEDLEDVELSSEVSAQVEAAVEAAERDLEEARVNFRWGQAQVAMVKRAAALAGVPYQTYIKHVAWRQAVADLRDTQALRLEDV